MVDWPDTPGGAIFWRECGKAPPRFHHTTQQVVWRDPSGAERWAKNVGWDGDGATRWWRGVTASVHDLNGDGSHELSVHGSYGGPHADGPGTLDGPTRLILVPGVADDAQSDACAHMREGLPQDTRNARWLMGDHAYMSMAGWLGEGPRAHVRQWVERDAEGWGVQEVWTLFVKTGEGWRADHSLTTRRGALWAQAQNAKPPIAAPPKTWGADVAWRRVRWDVRATRDAFQAALPWGERALVVARLSDGREVLAEADAIRAGVLMGTTHPLGGVVYEDDGNVEAGRYEGWIAAMCATLKASTDPCVIVRAGAAELPREVRYRRPLRWEPVVSGRATPLGFAGSCLPADAPMVVPAR